MSWQKELCIETLKAKQDFRQYQFRIVELSTAEINACDYPLQNKGWGVLQNMPNLNEAASVAVEGQTLCAAGGAVAIGDYITAAASGTGGPGWATKVTSGLTGPVMILGRARSAAASGSLFTLDLDPYLYAVDSGGKITF